MKPPKAVQVSLNVEETGWLCHLLMAQEPFRNAVLAGFGSEIAKRQLRLYEKLSAANDRLMGKIK